MLILKLTAKTSIFRKKSFWKIKFDNFLSVDKYVENAIVTLFLIKIKLLKIAAFSWVKLGPMKNLTIPC